MLSVDLKPILILLTIGISDSVFSTDPTVKNVIYGMDHGSALLMDVYQPEMANGAGIVFIMGTGFTAYGEYDDIPLKELAIWLLEHGIFSDFYGEFRQAYVPFIERGFTVFSINHRLGPKHHFRSQIGDCQRAVQFIRHNASKYGIQPSWIASMGHSSGATMAALLGVLDDIADSTALDPVSQQSSRVQAVISAAGVHDLLKAVESNPLTAPILQSFTGKAVTYQPPGHPVFEAYKRASTVSYIDAGDPPFFLMHGDEDPAVDVSQSKILQASLNASGVPNQLLILPGTNHAELGKATDPLPFALAASWLLDQFNHSARKPILPAESP